jgi:2-succinyl-6-hydroxy-2,4-cyclohexadiene-1-carboxylate synthase
LHGFLGCKSDFDEIIEIVSTHFYCIAIDIPGHGDTKEVYPLEDVKGVKEDTDSLLEKSYKDFNAPLSKLHYKFEYVAECLHVFIQQLISISYSGICSVGYSMGGRLLYYLLLHYPQFYIKNIIESASPGIDSEEERSERREEDQKLSLLLLDNLYTSQNFIHNWYSKSLFYNIREKETFPSLVKRRIRFFSSMLADALNGLSSGLQPAFFSKLGSIATPLLIISGDKDYKYREINDRLKQQSDFIQHVCVEECGHAVHVEAHLRFSEIILEFLISEKNQLL